MWRRGSRGDVIGRGVVQVCVAGKTRCCDALVLVEVAFGCVHVARLAHQSGARDDYAAGGGATASAVRAGSKSCQDEPSMANLTPVGRGRRSRQKVEWGQQASP